MSKPFLDSQPVNLALNGKIKRCRTPAPGRSHPSGLPRYLNAELRTVLLPPLRPHVTPQRLAMIFTPILVAFSTALLVSAQGTGTGEIPPCALACATESASANECKDIADLACICGNPQFSADAIKCVTDNCSTLTDSAVAQQWFRAQCAAASITPTGTATTPKTLSVSFSKTSAAATSTAPPAATTSASTSGNGASLVGVGAALPAMAVAAVVLGVTIMLTP
ncbi:hypothetical protein FA13DRAFT_1814984 [Coprinellus micaceus]|uniref:CFEM domain-containing protein n=1 Tax=Coprinellus micaceus TaxID=71717 RepID=A0A4Y7T8H4_COPMI|nr:hypothetical protein FA13DRAFT_1814984 [Coprinellus micaceus]